MITNNATVFSVKTSYMNPATKTTIPATLVGNMFEKIHETTGVTERSYTLHAHFPSLNKTSEPLYFDRLDELYSALESFQRAERDLQATK